MFLSKAPAFMPAGYSFIYLSLFILQSIHLCRYSTYSGFLHIPLPGLSDILATSIPLHFVVFITILSAGTFVSLLIYVPIPNATFALPLKYLYSLSAPVKIKTVTKYQSFISCIYSKTLIMLKHFLTPRIRISAVMSYPSEKCCICELEIL